MSEKDDNIREMYKYEDDEFDNEELVYSLVQNWEYWKRGELE